MQSGKVNCWGAGEFGRLDSGQVSNQTTPAEVLTLAGAVAIGAGCYHTCAAIDDGSVKCWGRNNYGQIGDGSLVNRLAPVFASVTLSATDVAIGAAHSCARSVVVGGSHSCGLTTTGEVKCWGADARGQLGDDNVAATLPRPWPAAVTTMSSGVVRLAAGRDHNCALRNTGALQCWGYNASIQLGDGTVVLRTPPVAASNVNGSIREIALGADSSCAVLASGDGTCWGHNAHGRLGNGSVLPASLAVPQSIAQWLQNDLIFRNGFER